MSQNSGERAHPPNNPGASCQQMKFKLDSFQSLIKTCYSICTLRVEARLYVQSKTYRLLTFLSRYTAYQRVAKQKLLILTAEIDLLTPNPYIIKTQKWSQKLTPSKFAKKHFSWPPQTSRLEHCFLGGTPGGGGGYSDLSWTGVCRSRLKPLPILKGKFVRKGYPFLRIFLEK